MPRIPFQQAESTIPATAGGVFAPMDDKVGEAITKSGNVLQTVVHSASNQLASDARYEWMIDRGQKQTEGLQHGHAVKNDADLWVSGLKDRTDYQKFEEDTEKAIGEFRDKYSKVVTDPYVQKIFEPYFQRAATEMRHVARVRKADAISQQGKAAWIEETDGSIRDWVNTPDPEVKKQIEAGFARNTNELARTGILKQVEAANAIKKFGSNAELAYITEVGATDPSRALNELDDKTKLTKIDPLVREKLRAALVGKAKNQRIDAVSAELTTEYDLDTDEPDWEGAIRSLYDRDNLKRWGIDWKESQSLFADMRQRFELERQFGKRDTKDVETETTDKFYGLLNAGKTKEAFDFLRKADISEAKKYDIKQKVIQDQRQSAHFSKWQSEDDIKKTQKKAEKYIMDHVRPDQAGFAIQTYRSGLSQYNVGAEQMESYAREITAYPQYTKKTDKSGKLSEILKVDQGGKAPQALQPIPANVIKSIMGKAKTKAEAEAMARSMGYDPDRLAPGK